MNIKLYFWNIISKLFKMAKSKLTIDSNINSIRTKCNDISKVISDLKRENIYDDDMINLMLEDINKVGKNIVILQKKTNQHFENLKKK